MPARHPEEIRQEGNKSLAASTYATRTSSLSQRGGVDARKDSDASPPHLFEHACSMPVPNLFTKTLSRSCCPAVPTATKATVQHAPCRLKASKRLTEEQVSSHRNVRFNMPKQERTPKIRMARVAANELPSESGAATTIAAGNVNVDDGKPPKLRLPEPAAAIREALHADGREPSKDEIARAYKDIVSIVGPKYTRKIHSNYFSNKRRARMSGRDLIAAKMENTPNPTKLDLMVWKYTTGLSFKEVCRIATAELSDVVKERAKAEHLLNSYQF